MNIEINNNQPTENKEEIMVTLEEKNVLVNKIINLLTDYDYETSHEGVSEIINEWSINKASLIEAFKKHPNYVPEQYCIVLYTEINRGIDSYSVANFYRYIRNLAIDSGRFEFTEQENDFIVHKMPFMLSQFVSEEDAETINSTFTTLHIHNGQKTSRVINKIMTYLGIAADSEYNQKYATYSDAISPRIFKRPTILSINPLDYYTMSFGNSWASCHTIDKTNRRNMPDNYHGCYSSGTESYMLDGTSMILYTISETYTGTEYWSQDKINRQMFHYGGEKIIQGRLYPQSNDGDSSAYTPFRRMVQDIISQVYGFENLWTIGRGTEKATEYIYSEGSHYRDYEYFEECTRSKLKNSQNDKYIVVGHNPICPSCGCTHRDNENILCYDCQQEKYVCQHCGCGVTGEDTYFIDGDPYCCDCVEYCEYCRDYVLRDDGIYVDEYDQFVCDYHYSQYFTTCDCCDANVLIEDAVDVQGGRRFCRECADEHCHECEDCHDNAVSDDMTVIDGHHYCYACAEDHRHDDDSNNNN